VTKPTKFIPIIRKIGQFLVLYWKIKTKYSTNVVIVEN